MILKNVFSITIDINKKRSFYFKQYHHRMIISIKIIHRIEVQLTMKSGFCITDRTNDILQVFQNS